MEIVPLSGTITRAKFREDISTNKKVFHTITWFWLFSLGGSCILLWSYIGSDDKLAASWREKNVWKISERFIQTYGLTDVAKSTQLITLFIYTYVQLYIHIYYRFSDILGVTNVGWQTEYTLLRVKTIELRIYFSCPHSTC